MLCDSRSRRTGGPGRLLGSPDWLRAPYQKLPAAGCETLQTCFCTSQSANGWASRAARRGTVLDGTTSYPINSPLLPKEKFPSEKSLRNVQEENGGEFKRGDMKKPTSLLASRFPSADPVPRRPGWLSAWMQPPRSRPPTTAQLIALPNPVPRVFLCYKRT